MANKTFSLPRFGKYLSSDLKNAWASYGISFCILAAMPAIQEIFNNFFKFVFTGEWGGQPYVGRAVIFAFILLAVMISFPVKAYGRITERKEGTSFSMIPVSVFEKTVSMLLVSCIILPAAFCACYGAVDALVCAIDPSCGKWVFDMSSVRELISRIIEDSEAGDYSATLAGLVNPWPYVDDALQVILVFLLGAVCFKRGKVIKTILALVILGTALSMITAPFFVSITRQMAQSGDPGIFIEKFDWVFRNIVTLDTISDQLVNIALCVAIFFRIKTIKH